MFGKKQEPVETVVKICRYCSSNNIEFLKTSSGFGGGDVFGSEYFSKLYLCRECGRITNANQFTTNNMEGNPHE